MNYTSRYTQAIINLPKLLDNYQKMASLAPNSQTIAVIKADAYGHGAIAVAKALEAANTCPAKLTKVPAFAVAFIDEAIALRKSGITLPILVLEGAFQQCDLNIAQQYNFWLMFHNKQQLQWLLDAGDTFTTNVWFKVDTGMSRLGFQIDELTNIMKTAFFKKITLKKGELEQETIQQFVLCSHLSDAENITKDKTSQQIKQTLALAKQFNCQYSLANSAGIINWPASYGDWNRLGIALYTSLAIKPTVPSIQLQPVMTLQSSIISIRKLATGASVGYGEIWQAQHPSTIATVAIGYGDGYPRSAKVGTPVYLKNETAPLVGRVSMDMITIDITDLINKNIQINIGDKVELWGENLAVETIASYADTINYELLTRVSARVPRVYLSH